MRDEQKWYAFKGGFVNAKRKGYMNCSWYEKISFWEAIYKGWVYAKLNGAAPMIQPDPPPLA